MSGCRCASSAPPCRGEEPGGGEKTGRAKTHKTQNPHTRGEINTGNCNEIHSSNLNEYLYTRFVFLFKSAIVTTNVHIWKVTCRPIQYVCYIHTGAPLAIQFFTCFFLL